MIAILCGPAQVGGRKELVTLAGAAPRAWEGRRGSRDVNSLSLSPGRRYQPPEETNSHPFASMLLARLTLACAAGSHALAAQRLGPGISLPRDFAVYPRAALLDDFVETLDAATGAGLARVRATFGAPDLALAAAASGAAAAGRQPPKPAAAARRVAGARAEKALALPAGRGGTKVHFHRARRTAPRRPGAGARCRPGRVLVGVGRRRVARTAARAAAEGSQAHARAEAPRERL